MYTKAWRRRQLGAGGDEPEWGWWETGQEGPGSLRMMGPLQLLRPERWTWMDLGFRETEADAKSQLDQVAAVDIITKWR